LPGPSREDARSSRDAHYRDWYVWADPKPDGSPPNNWLSVFGGSAWTFDAGTGQCYFHAFLPQQPDLNWWNPDVRTAVHDAMRFWLERGVDGFRVDAVDMLLENPALPDNPPRPSNSTRAAQRHRGMFRPCASATRRSNASSVPTRACTSQKSVTS
jgi:alpha-glucosidase